MTIDNDLSNLLLQGAKKYNVDLDPKIIDKFFTYQALLKEWNEKINLTAIEEDRDVIIKHFIDSLSIMPYINKDLLPIAYRPSPEPQVRLIDIGTGAGFPGLPVKVVFNNVKVTLLDSLDKRIKFLREVISRLKLDGIDAVHGRAEDFGVNQEYREKFDIAVARAVANLPVLLEYCLPFVKVGGMFIAMKGSNIEEVDLAKKALDTLGGKIEEQKEITLPFSDIKRNIILVRKFRQTPTRFPRKAGKPSKEPLV